MVRVAGGCAMSFRKIAAREIGRTQSRAISLPSCEEINLLKLSMAQACAAAALMVTWPVAAQQKEAPKPAAQKSPQPIAQKPPAQKATQPPTQAAAKKPEAKPPAKSAVYRPPRGPVEKLDCKIGTEDQHARIAVLAQGGEVQSIAYYSKWKPRTCSIHLQRNDAYSRWKDGGDATVVTTEYGDVLVQERKTEYKFVFREVDRMHYCGMMGKINGTMTITRGPKRTCTIEGVMDRQPSEVIEELAAQKPDEVPAIPSVTPTGPLTPELALPGSERELREAGVIKK